MRDQWYGDDRGLGKMGRASPFGQVLLRETYSANRLFSASKWGQLEIDGQSTLFPNLLYPF